MGRVASDHASKAAYGTDIDVKQNEYRAEKSGQIMRHGHRPQAGETQYGLRRGFRIQIEESRDDQQGEQKGDCDQIEKLLEQKHQRLHCFQARSLPESLTGCRRRPVCHMEELSVHTPELAVPAPHILVPVPRDHDHDEKNPVNDSQGNTGDVVQIRCQLVVHQRKFGAGVRKHDSGQDQHEEQYSCGPVPDPDPQRRTMYGFHRYHRKLR